MDLNTIFFGAIIALSLAIFFYIGKFKASSKQRDRDDKIEGKGSKFTSVKILLCVMATILGVALLATSFS